MIKIIDSMLNEFEGCFTRKASFYWFAIILFAFIVRLDHSGITSFIRGLFLNPIGYESMLGFFRASSWDLNVLLAHWAKQALAHYPCLLFQGRVLLIGDGIKVSQEAKHRPGVKSLHQDSDNSGKADSIWGHHFGFVGLLMGTLQKAFCLPLRGQLHEGIETLRPGQEFNGKPATLLTRMAYLIVETAKSMKCLGYVVLDAYFATGPAFLIFKAAVNDQREQWIHLITRAKDNYVAYFENQGLGRRFQEKDKLPLREIFDYPETFTTIELVIYGQLKTLHYCCVDLLWKPIKDKIRFVCIIDGNEKYILMCSDLELHPEIIITLYSYRNKIEVMFLFLKHLIGGFFYHFWTRYFPKVKRGESIHYSTLTKAAQKRGDLTVEAIERFVNLAGIALGLLQYLSLTQAAAIWKVYPGWLRTYSCAVPSESIVQAVVRAEFFFSLGKVFTCRTLRLIQERAVGPPSLNLTA